MPDGSDKKIAGYLVALSATQQASIRSVEASLARLEKALERVVMATAVAVESVKRQDALEEKVAALEKALVALNKKLEEQPRSAPQVAERERERRPLLQHEKQALARAAQQQQGLRP